jgi:single-strand selective monofunctional uracil DNA glycosylase
MMCAAVDLMTIALELRERVATLSFAPPVSHVYNPLEYAWDAHSCYLKHFGHSPKEVLLVGMNPGPWGMAQTGVPFGEVGAAREWMGIRARVGRPATEHPRRPVEGFECRRSEVSGQRLWGWARDRFETPERFFSRFWVHNYCPLMFLESSGRNRTPDRLPAAERRPLEEICDRALHQTVDALSVRTVVGIGRFAAERARHSLAGSSVAVGQILHPSPASPAANRGWAEQAERQFAELGIELERPRQIPRTS